MGHCRKQGFMTKRCTRCILPGYYPGIDFDPTGLCNHCRDYDQQWENHDFHISEGKLKLILENAKNKNRAYDCLVPISGGLDSSYTLYVIKQVYGLNPLAVNYDNGFQTDLARHNIQKLTKTLGVDLKVIAPDPQMLKKLYRIFLKTGAEPCTPCELGGTGAIYQTAAEINAPLIVFGTSVRTEGIAPKDLHYFDVRYFRDVIKGKFPFSEVDKIFFFPGLLRMFYLQIVKGIKTIQLPYYLPWKEKEIENLLKTRFGWKKGDKPHADCAFFPIRDYIRCKNWKFGAATQRLSAKIRDGQITREEALRIVRTTEGRMDDAELAAYLKIMNLTPSDIESVVLKNYRNFKTYLPLLNRVKWIIHFFSKLNLLPENIEKKLK
jgi:N-acetyl sugar amidotransferase